MQTICINFNYFLLSLSNNIIKYKSKQLDSMMAMIMMIVKQRLAYKYNHHQGVFDKFEILCHVSLLLYQHI